MSIVKVFLWLGSAYFILVHVDKFHAERIPGTSQALKIHLKDIRLCIIQVANYDGGLPSLCP